MSLSPINRCILKLNVYNLYITGERSVFMNCIQKTVENIILPVHGCDFNAALMTAGNMER